MTFGQRYILTNLNLTSILSFYEKGKSTKDYFIRTNVPPKRWSELESKYWQPLDDFLPEVKSQAEREAKESSQPNHSSTQVKSPFKTFICQFPQPVSFNMLKEYCEPKGKLLGAKLMRGFAQQFMDIGDCENGIACLAFAYANTFPTEWPPWKKNQNDLKMIAEYDRQKALRLIVEEAYRLLNEERERLVPGTIAHACYTLGEIEYLKRLYNEYFQYCQELFVHLPRQNRYQWLKAYSTKADDWQQVAIHFLVDVLDTVDINAGNRLIDAYRELCLTRPEIALPVFIERLSDANELVKSRLLIILYTVSYYAPQLLLPHVDNITEYLEVNHFQWKILVLRLLQNVLQYGDGSEQIQRKIERVEYRYSSRVTSSTFRLLHISPSHEFVKFFTERTLNTIQRQITSCCHILSLDFEAVLAKIEQTLKREGWTVESEKRNLKSEWDGYVHPQGYPYVSIITSFEQKVLFIFNQLLDEIIEKTGVGQGQVETLWRILQPVDPEYTLSDIQPRPQDISPLSVSNKDAWLSELKNDQAEIIREPVAQEWLTLFEKRVVSQRDGYSNSYRLAIFIHSSLVKQGILPSEELLEDSWNVLKLVAFDDDEFVTLQQAREYLITRQFLPTDELILRSPSLPVVSMKTNSPLFLGYSTILSLPRYLIEKYGLVYRGFDLYDDDECVVRYEVWQEGYEDDPYSRDLLSHGTRLLIHKNLLTTIFQDYHVELCQGIFEKRLCFESKHSPEPTEQSDWMEFVIVHQ